MIARQERLAPCKASLETLEFKTGHTTARPSKGKKRNKEKKKVDKLPESL